MEDNNGRLVKSKPIDRKILQKLPEFHKPRDFITASTSSPRASGRIERKLRTNEDNLSSSSENSKKLTDEELNQLAAKIMKAEMMGNTELVEKLKEKLRESDESGSTLNREEGDEETETDFRSKDVLLTKTDLRSGITYPVKGKNRVTEDDDKRSKKAKTDNGSLSSNDIHNLLMDEKCTSAEEQLAMFGATSSKIITSEKVDDSWTIDDVIGSKLDKNSNKKKKFEEDDIKRAVKAFKAREATLDSCSLCLENKQLQRHLVVAIGLKTYLSVVPAQPLIEHQCLIVPSSHVSSCLQMDEDVYDEMKIWRKGLVAMFRAENKDVIFVETAKNVMHQPHAYVECFPIPMSIAEDAPLYFKKAIMESEKEWTLNKKIIDLSKKDLRRSIPIGFSYVAVDFGLQPGYAHVIEDESMIASSFGKEIVAGMNDIDSNLWRRPVKQTVKQQIKRTEALRDLWKPFDWTERVKERLRNQGSEKL